MEKMKTMKQKQHFKNNEGFPGGSVVKNLPANAGSTPGLGKFHMLQSSQARGPQLLSLRSRAREPQPRSHVPQPRKPSHLELMLCNKRAAAARSPHTTTGEQPPLAAAREKACAATETQHSQK